MFIGMVRSRELRYRKEYKMRVDRICIDPGHGGKDIGAEFRGLFEKNVTMNVARYLYYILSATGWDTEEKFVTLTRPGDMYLSLEERCQKANNSRVDLFISLHCNADADSDMKGDPVAKGEEIWYYSEKGRQIAGIFADEVDKFFKWHFRGIKKAGFYVLKHTNMPAILIEMGFIDNPLTNQAFKNDIILRRIALILTLAILRLEGI